MTPERWQQIDKLLEEALEREAGERAAFLDHACAGDEELRYKVDALLAAHRQAESFIETPAFEAAAQALADQARSMVGRQLGHYEVLALLGAGGMGEVYRARDTKLDRLVALKFLPATVAANRERMQRFIREARAASAINHPNVATIYEIGETDGISYIAMEYVEGETLQARLGNGPLASDDVVGIGIQIADALEVARTQGITHRDIKPANLMLTPRGQVKVLDFGLAKMTRAAELAEAGASALGTTAPGIVMGTVHYMSPEQVLGRELDHRTDIFSLGVVLYEMATGSLPFAGANMGEAIDQILHGEADSLSSFNSQVPAELNWIVRKCLERERERRYQTARELLVDLKNLQRDSGSATTLARPAALHSAEKRKHKLLYALLSSAFLLILAAAALFIVLRHRSFKPHVPFEQTKMARATTGGNVTCAALSPDGRYVVYAKSSEGQESLWLKQTAIASDVQITKPEAVIHQGLTFSPDGNAIFYVVRDSNSLGELFQLPMLGGLPKKLIADIDSTITFSPDGRQISFFRGYPDKGESKLVVANADGTQQRELVSLKRPDFFPTLLDSAPSWSPVGAVIACPTGSGGNAEGRMTVVAMQPESGDVRPLASRRWWYVGHAAWLHDGSGLVIIAKEQASDPSQIWHLSYPSGEARRITNDLNNYVGVSMNRRGSATFVTVQSNVLSSILVAPNEASAKEVPISAVDGVAGISWTPDGQIVFSARLKGNQDIYVMGQNGSNQRQLTANASDNNWPSVSPDGRYIIFISNRTGSSQIWRMNLDGSNPKQLTNGNDARWPRCTPDSQWVVYASLSKQAGLYKVSIEGGTPVQLTDKAPTSLAISPDGKLIATGYREDPGADRTAIYQFEGGAPLRVLNFSTVYLSWQQDGSALAYIDQYKRNIVSQRIDGPQMQLTDFKEGTITAFDWSRDGRLACARKVVIADAVIVSSNESSMPE